MSGNSRSQNSASPLEVWLDEELRVAVSAMLKSISATQLTRERKVFGQRVMPVRGSVVGSPEFGSYDPDPDYFFHWLRDSALVMDALREAMLAGLVGEETHTHFADFVRFSLSLADPMATRTKLDRAAVDPRYRQYLRPDSELDCVSPDRLRSEPRFNPDGTIDFLKWARPQLDGPALRALAGMRYWPLCPAGAGEERRRLEQLIREDLSFTARHARELCYDIWEEALGEHYYTRLVQFGALAHGSRWLRAVGGPTDVTDLGELESDLAAVLDRFWSPAQGMYLAGAHNSAQREGRNPDAANMLGVLHAQLSDGAHSIVDPKVQATLGKLEGVFAANLAINRSARGQRAPALGRYPADVYFEGGAWYLTTLAAAELYFRLAAATGSGGFVARGDQFLETVRRFTPSSGELSEQIDRETGEQISAKNLPWSYAAFITACTARSRAEAALGR